MVEVEAKKVVLKNLAGEYLVPITEPYIAGEGIKIEDNVISADVNKVAGVPTKVSELENDSNYLTATQVNNIVKEKVNADANNFSYVGKNFICGLGSPSTNHIALTVGVSKSTYTAPANGWFYILKTVGVGIVNFYNTVTEVGTMFYQGVESPVKCYVPVLKGEKVLFEYSVPKVDAYHQLLFIYAEGSK